MSLLVVLTLVLLPFSACLALMLVRDNLAENARLGRWPASPRELCYTLRLRLVLWLMLRSVYRASPASSRLAHYLAAGLSPASVSPVFLYSSSRVDYLYRWNGLLIHLRVSADSIVKADCYIAPAVPEIGLVLHLPGAKTPTS